MSVTAVGRREMPRGVWSSERAPLLTSHLRHFMCGMNWQACLNTQMRSVRGASVSNESWYSLRGTEQLQLLWAVVYKSGKKKKKRKKKDNSSSNTRKGARMPKSHLVTSDPWESTPFFTHSVALKWETWSVVWMFHWGGKIFKLHGWGLVCEEREGRQKENSVVCVLRIQSWVGLLSSTFPNNSRAVR